MSSKPVFITRFYPRCVVAIALLLPIFLASCGTPSVTAVAEKSHQISGTYQPAPFAIERLELSFVNGRASVTLKSGQPVKVRAVIKYRGRGHFSARWRLDGVVVRQEQINLSHGSLLTLIAEDPSLFPTFIAGQHRIQLEIISPPTSLAMPSIHYFVTHE
jgi:hypothetical protein